MPKSKSWRVSFPFKIRCCVCGHVCAGCPAFTGPLSYSTGCLYPPGPTVGEKIQLRLDHPAWPPKAIMLGGGAGGWGIGWSRNSETQLIPHFQHLHGGAGWSDRFTESLPAWAQHLWWKPSRAFCAARPLHCWALVCIVRPVEPVPRGSQECVLGWWPERCLVNRGVAEEGWDRRVPNFLCFFQ